MSLNFVVPFLVLQIVRQHLLRIIGNQLVEKRVRNPQYLGFFLCVLNRHDTIGGDFTNDNLQRVHNRSLEGVCRPFKVDRKFSRS